MSDPFRALTIHFHRRLYAATDNSASETTVVRSLAAVATPMLMLAFWIVTLAGRVPPWSMAEMHYLFVLYSFCAMGCVTALQWDRLFPDRADFLILLPLPLRPRTLFCAKLASVASFLLLFLTAANIFGTLLFPMLSGRTMPKVLLAHAIAVFSAGCASSLAVLALEALVIILAPERWYRRVAPLVQALLVAMFLLLLFRMGDVSQHLSLLLGGAAPAAGWFPLLWFAAVYETFLGGVTATGFAHTLSHRAWECLPILLILVAILYPLAWVRRKRMALEGARGARLRDNAMVQRLLHAIVLPQSDQRAIFHFVGKTLSRLARYHVLLAVYSGAGTALCLAVAIKVDVTANGLHWSVWRTGAQMAIPILLFWTVAGLRVAFLLPDELSARWIFRLAPLETGRVISTVKRLVFAACLAVLAAIEMALALNHWRPYDLFQQAVYGCLLAMLLADIFFFLESSIPFTRPSLPDRSSLPLTLAVYVFGLPLSILLMLTLEHWIGHSAVRLLITIAAAAIVHALFHYLRYLPSHAVSADPFLGEMDEEVQTLGLSL